LKVIFLIIPLILAISSILNIYAQEQNDTRLILELEGLTETKIIKFEIGEKVYKTICPSDQCSIEYTHAFLSAPDPNTNDWGVGFAIDFNLHDDITNANLTAIQKKFVELFHLAIGCDVNNVRDIVEKDDRVIYHCNCGTADCGLAIVHAIKPTLYFYAKGVYDTKTENFKLVGNFDEKDITKYRERVLAEIEPLE